MATKLMSNPAIMAQKETSNLAAELAASSARQAAELAAKSAEKAAELAGVATVVSVNIQYIQEDIREIKQAIKEMSTMHVTKEEFKSLKDNSVSKSELDPIKRIVYGLVGLILVAVASSVVALVVIP